CADSYCNSNARLLLSISDHPDTLAHELSAHSVLSTIRSPPRSTLFPTRRSSDLATIEVAELMGAESYLYSKLNGQDFIARVDSRDRKSTRLNSSHVSISYAVFCLKKKTSDETARRGGELRERSCR